MYMNLTRTDIEWIFKTAVMAIITTTVGMWLATGKPADKELSYYGDNPKLNRFVDSVITEDLFEQNARMQKEAFEKAEQSRERREQPVKNIAAIFGRVIGGVYRLADTVASYTAGRYISRFDETTLRQFMYDRGFKNLDDLDLGMLRRTYLAYHYDALFWDVHEKTKLPISFIFAVFIYEATSQGKETDLFAEHGNPGGIKYRGKGYPVPAFDDCYDKQGRKIPCNFEGLRTYDQTVEVWSSVFNADRYKPCKKKKSVAQICACFQEKGYHTGNSWKQRANIATQYWKIRRSFPHA